MKFVKNVQDGLKSLTSTSLCHDSLCLFRCLSATIIFSKFRVSLTWKNNWYYWKRIY